MKIKKNGKVITLSESDLKRIVNVVLKEENEMDPVKDFEKCCKDAGIKAPMGCVSGDASKCIEELGKMVSSDPLGMGMKVVSALNCVKDKAGSPVMN